MAYEELDTDFAVGDPVRATWMNQIGANDADHEARITDVETTAVDHESRIDLLEGTGPSSQRIYTATGTLTNEDIKALPTTFYTLVATPPLGYMISFKMATLMTYFSAGAAYGNLAADAYAYIGFDGSEAGGSLASAYIPDDSGAGLTELTSLLVTTTDTTTVLLPFQKTGSGWEMYGFARATSGRANLPLKLAVISGSGNLTGGNAANYLTYAVDYSLIPVPAGMPFPFRSMTIQPRRPDARRRRTGPGASNALIP